MGLLSWLFSRRSYDATGSAAMLRSERVRAAAEDLPKIHRCSKCPSFVQVPGTDCFRCDPSVLAAEREARERRLQKGAVVRRFRRVAR